MMPLHFRERKATQAAARFLKLRGGRMYYLKLLKLLYFADRKALLELGRPITFDRYVSMKNGPVLSQAYNLVVEEDDPIMPTYWREFISPPKDYQVELVADAPAGELSAAEEAIIEAVFKQFGHMNRWDIVKIMHGLPEWHDPGSSTIPIDLEDVLKAGGMSESAIHGIEEDLAAEDAVALLN